MNLFKKSLVISFSCKWEIGVSDVTYNNSVMQEKMKGTDQLTYRNAVELLLVQLKISGDQHNNQNR